ncbi:MAG: alpha/beta hydrolase [Rhizomicrobium sp.]
MLSRSEQAARRGRRLAARPSQPAAQKAQERASGAVAPPLVNGVHDGMIPVPNSYRLAENLPNAVLPTDPDAGHGSLFQYLESSTRQVAAFLASDSPFAPY